MGIRSTVAQPRPVRSRPRGVRRLSRLLLLCLSLLAAWSRPAAAVETGCVISGAPAGADVFIDDRKVGTTPLPGALMISIGVHQLRVQRPGHTPYSEPLRIMPGRLTQVIVDMPAVAGVLRLRANVPATRVLLDGAFVGEAPVEVEMPIGPHVVIVGREGYREVEFSVVAVGGQILERDIKLVESAARAVIRRPTMDKETHWYQRWWVWTLGAVVAGGVAAAIIVPTLQASRQPCQRLDVEFCIPVDLSQTNNVTRTQGGALLSVGGRF